MLSWRKQKCIFDGLISNFRKDCLRQRSKNVRTRYFIQSLPFYLNYCIENKQNF